MKIMYVVSSLEKCGPVNVLFNIIKEACTNNNCTILTLSPENTKSMLDEFKKYNVSIIQLNMKRNISNKKYKKEIIRIIKKLNPDFIHTHGLRSDMYIHQLNKDHSFIHITTLHNFTFSDYPRLYGLLVGFVLSVYHTYVISQIENKIACSFSIAKKYKVLNINNILVIQNGVDLNEFKPKSDYQKKSLRKLLKLPINKKIVISTGALIKRKRPIKLMKVFNNKFWGNDVTFIVLGDGKLINKIKKYKNDNIRILGSVNNVTDYLQAADVFVSNSKAEGLPMAMLEAAATGLMIVGTNILPHQEVKKLYKNKTILYEGQKTKTIVKKIKYAISKSVVNEKNDENNYKLSSKYMAYKYLSYYKNRR